MMNRIAFTFLCVFVASVLCEYNYDGPRPYPRNKRGKYSNVPSMFYIPPPPSSPNRGPVYGPPSYPRNPGPPYPGNSRPPKVSKPQLDGLGDEDIHDLVNNLSKSDLDKIIQLSGRVTDSESYSKEPYEAFNDYSSTQNEIKSVYASGDNIEVISDDNDDYFKTLVQEMEAEGQFQQIQTDEHTYATPPYIPQNIYSSHNEYPISLDVEESMSRHQYSNTNVHTDSVIEENLPEPSNLRHNEDFEISFTKNVPKVLQPADSYELKNFGDLPVMNYDSKLDTLDSYHVPHYTVTSHTKPRYYAPPQYGAKGALPPLTKVPPLEPAPPPSAAQSQSDAHLKAVKIWSHRSPGTAYYLHKDGTLSLENPGLPSGGYGYP